MSEIFLDYAEFNDPELMARIEGGDRHAFSTLYDRHINRVFGTAMASLRDRGIAEEVTQDVFLRVWRNSSSYNPQKSKFTTWLTTITRNRVVDTVRKLKRFTKESPDGDYATLISIPSNETGPEEASVIKIESERVEQAMSALPNEQRTVVLMAYFKGMTHSEISQELRVPSGTVKTRMRLAMLKLRSALDHQQ